MKKILFILIILVAVDTSFAALTKDERSTRQRIIQQYGTKSAVMEFQRSLGFTGNELDGIVGPRTTRAALAKESPTNPNSNPSGEAATSRTPAGATVGNMASLFAYEQNGSKEKEGKQGGKTMSCGQKMVPGKCFAAISRKKRIEICGSDKSHCYCGMMATVNFPGKQPIKVPIYDTGITKNNGNMIDLSGECFNKGNVKNGRDQNVRDKTTWHVEKGQTAGKYVLNGNIKETSSGDTQTAELK
jgi:peptidoglycan hydrolase-like protein with peptidoglycan-binding domain